MRSRQRPAVLRIRHKPVQVQPLHARHSQPSESGPRCGYPSPCDNPGCAQRIGHTRIHCPSSVRRYNRASQFRHRRGFDARIGHSFIRRVNDYSGARPPSNNAPFANSRGSESRKNAVARPIRRPLAPSHSTYDPSHKPRTGIDSC